MALVIFSIIGAREQTSASQEIAAANVTAHNDASNPGQTTARYRIVPDQSQFMVEAYSGGLLWFMGHTHHFAVRNFTGEAQVSPEMLEPASLSLQSKQTRSKKRERILQKSRKR